jgi:RNA polymerase sigma-70 factor (ECF subfamily)
VEAFEMAVFGLCRRLLGGSESEAEDLCQETFVQAFRYLPTLEDRTRFGPWLYQIARSLCRSHRRRRALERRVLAAEAVSLRWREGSSRAGQAGDADQAAEALAELPAPEREALELRYFEGLSYGEIAARTGLSFSRVDHLIRKARARLRRRFKVREERARTL